MAQQEIEKFLEKKQLWTKILRQLIEMPEHLLGSWHHCQLTRSLDKAGAEMDNCNPYLFRLKDRYKQVQCACCGTEYYVHNKIEDQIFLLNNSHTARFARLEYKSTPLTNREKSNLSMTPLNGLLHIDED